MGRYLRSVNMITLLRIPQFCSDVSNMSVRVVSVDPLHVYLLEAHLPVLVVLGPLEGDQVVRVRVAGVLVTITRVHLDLVTGCEEGY